MPGKHILLAAALAAITTPALAQATDSESTQGSTNIIQLLNLLKNNDLRFGTIVRPQMGSTVVSIDQMTGGRSLNNGNAVLVNSNAGRAEFSVFGFGGESFSILTPSTFNLTRQGGSGTIAVNLLRSADDAIIDGSAGVATFGVGGNFTLSDSTEYGFYTGTFDVTIQYQ